MAGWNLKEGDCLNLNATEHELWDAINCFYKEGHKTTTYKFCFFKSLLDLVDDGAGETLSFNAVFSRFTQIYWELITKYGLNQAHATSQYATSKVETLIDEFIATKGLTYDTSFQSVRSDWKQCLTSAVEKQCSSYVIGAFYTSTDCLFYGFSKKDHCIQMSAAAVVFCKTYFTVLEEINYYHWAKMLEKINGDSTPKALVTKMSQLGKMASVSKYEYFLNDLTQMTDSNIRYSLVDIIPWNF